MENKKGKDILIFVLICIIIILILIMIYLIGFKGKNSDKNNNSTTMTTTTIYSGIIQSIDKFPTKNDANVLDLTPIIDENLFQTNFKNVDMSKNGIKVVIDCEEYDEYCAAFNINVDDKIFLADRFFYGCPINSMILKYNNYTIVGINDGCISKMELNIYNSNYEKIYTNENLYSAIYQIESMNNSNLDTTPVIKDNILYFVEGEENVEVLKLKYIDLSKSIIKDELISIFNGSHAEKD